MTKEDFIQWRKQNGLTQNKLAKLLGVSDQTIRQWESGRYFGTHKPIKIPNHIALAISALDAGLKPYPHKHEWDTLL